jgi:GT2 family glycosyltransferase
LNEAPSPKPVTKVYTDADLPGPTWLRREAPEVSVIIPHHDDLDNLRRCLALLAAQTMPSDAFEIVVADNNSRCGIAAVEKACAGLALVVPAPIQGAAEARNAGVRASRGRLLAFIDSDCRPSPEWLERGIKALDGADMVGGRVDVDVLDADDPTAVEAFEMVFAFNFKRYVEEQGFSGSGNMFVSRAIFDRVGGFRAGVAEDVDWGHRAVALGYRWRYAPDAAVSHPARRDWADLKRKWRRLVNEAYAAKKEQPFGKLRWVLRSWLILFSPLFHTASVLRSSKLHRFDLRLKAIIILFRLRCWRFWKSYVVLFTQT